MKTRIRHFLEIISANIWMVPLAFLLGAMAIAVFNFYADTVLISKQIKYFDGYLDFRNAENIRTILSVSATSILGVAGVSFSITVASLTLASQQFGSRLLRNFMMDRFNQIVLGVFIGTFMYCVMMLHFTGSMDLENTTPFISMIGLLILVVTSLLMLVFFIHHIAVSIQADSVISDVNGLLQLQLNKLFPDARVDKEHLTERLSTDKQDDIFNDKALAIFANKSGYLQAVDQDSLLSFINDNNLAVKLTVKPGDFLIKNSQIGLCLCTDEDSADFYEKVNCPINDSLLIGDKSTAEQDPEFAFRQLVEVAIRALSPSINDPFTAIVCINRIGDNIAFLMSRDFPSEHHFDEEGRLRLITKPYSFEGIVEASFNQIRQNGRSDVAVTICLFDTLYALAQQAQTLTHARAICTQVNALYSASNENFNAQKDRDDIKDKFDAVDQLLGERFEL
ncbi:DUF2254 domain-containing protein [Leucothrix sargassi]|nr:DUF2254 domain-containing protein [Leucothrix sargassi]